MLPGNAKCSMKSLADTKHILRGIKFYLWGLEFRSWLRPRAVNRLRDEIIKSLALSLGTTYKQRERFNLKWLLQGYHKIYD